MKKFDFQGDWFTTIGLSTFNRVLDNPKYSFRRKDLQDAEYQIEIHDVYDDNPDLSQEQKNTVQHLQDETNQYIILKNIFIYLQEVVAPEYQKELPHDEYLEIFKQLYSVNDLNQLIGLDHVVLLRFGLEDSCFYNLMFETSIDEEHGIGFVLHENTIIEHGAIGGMMYEKVTEYMGLSNEQYASMQDEIQTPPTRELQLPSKKYGKLKPWQDDVNKDYPYYLYSLKNDSRIIQEIESETIAIEVVFRKLRPHIIRDNRVMLVEFFKAKGYL